MTAITDDIHSGDMPPAPAIRVGDRVQWQQAVYRHQGIRDEPRYGKVVALTPEHAGILCGNQATVLRDDGSYQDLHENYLTLITNGDIPPAPTYPQHRTTHRLVGLCAILTSIANDMTRNGTAEERAAAMLLRQVTGAIEAAELAAKLAAGERAS